MLSGLKVSSDFLHRPKLKAVGALTAVINSSMWGERQFVSGQDKNKRRDERAEEQE
jgi:hypothetical protein